MASGGPPRRRPFSTLASDGLAVSPTAADPLHDPQHSLSAGRASPVPRVRLWRRAADSQSRLEMPVLGSTFPGGIRTASRRRAGAAHASTAADFPTRYFRGSRRLLPPRNLTPPSPLGIFAHPFPGTSPNEF